MKKGFKTGSRLFALVAAFLHMAVLAFAQQAPAGKITGKVKDSVYNYMLPTATIAVYRQSDTSLVKFTLPDRFGEFVLPALPGNVALRLVVSHLGYTPFVVPFRIGESMQFDFGTIFLHQNKGMLKEVTVMAIAPVRMNGDTLEFNADAFRLDSSATAEDLIRKLPGFTVWGDGDITYNGKKIQQVLVEGKPFMGSQDPAIATQNLPKNALDKIQVYRQHNLSNPLDSTLSANIRLKPDKRVGYFGKVGGGYGTGERYAADGMLSGYTEKLQLSLVGAANNINKIATGTEMLLKSSTFQGEGVGSQYQSDFRMRGSNNAIAAGARLQYDMEPDFKPLKINRLKGDFFYDDQRRNIQSRSVENTYLKSDALLTATTRSQAKENSTSRNANAAYHKSTELQEWNVNATYSGRNTHQVYNDESERRQTDVGLLGNSVSQTERNMEVSRITAGFDFQNRANIMIADNARHGRVSRAFTLGYLFSAEEQSGNAATKSEFTSATDPLLNRKYDRLYERQDGRNSSHVLRASYPGLKRLIFHRAGLAGIGIGISANYNLGSKSAFDRILDKRSADGKFQVNPFLTNTRHENTSNFTPALNLSRSFGKDLSNRYNKTTSIHVNLQQQYYGLQSNADQPIQNISYHYSRFLPQASFTHTNHQYGLHETSYSLAFSTQANYPEIGRMAPLTDSADLWQVLKGNPELRPQYVRELTAGYSYTSRKPKNPWNARVNLAAGQTDNYFSDSLLYNASGVSTRYAVNIDGQRYASGSAEIRKAYQTRSGTFEAGGRYGMNKGRYPQYIDSKLNVSDNTSHQASVNISFRHKDLLILKAEHSRMMFNSIQKGFGQSELKSRNQSTMFSGALQLPVNIHWNTNLIFNRNRVNQLNPDNFVIWNASLGCRFLKGRQGEAKISALDILRQNKGWSNIVSGNAQVFTYSNILQQYFMLTVAYYPRKFGR
ncbi:outer membrane beta-barrel protein [Chitinophaga caseinilytica]|uniref:outer membrane beta-barrel protein n=1 Tax=Chitinophaga caseinilytica TaxID=2267521 RepID=UPI003C2FCBCF